MDYNHYRPDSSLARMTTAAFAELCRKAGSPALRLAGKMRVAEHIVTVSAEVEGS